MTEPDKNSASDAPTSTTEGAVGDLETAGETTAADTITGPPDTTPVGADTMAKVAYRPEGDDDD